MVGREIGVRNHRVETLGGIVNSVGPWNPSNFPLSHEYPQDNYCPMMLPLICYIPTYLSQRKFTLRIHQAFFTDRPRSMLACRSSMSVRYYRVSGMLLFTSIFSLEDGLWNSPAWWHCNSSSTSSWRATCKLQHSTQAKSNKAGDRSPFP